MLFRVSVLVGLAWFASLAHNPVVRLEAMLGLSPAPLERFVGVKGLFSGMTEGMYRLAHGDLTGAVAANAVTPFFALAVGCCLILGYRPRVHSRRDEWIFFTAVVSLCVVVNMVN